MDKIKLATIWLGGCSGCHMSFLDLDEWLFNLAEVAEMVYGPVVDAKEIPDDVDVFLVEGSLANVENLEMVREARRKSKFLIAFGDCAVTGNVPTMRNRIAKQSTVLERSYIETADVQAQIPGGMHTAPQLLSKVVPIHEAVKVDMHLPGCPPSAARIKAAIEELMAHHYEPLTGEKMIKFG